MQTGQERGPRSEKMPKCESLASHRACSWVLRKLWPKRFLSPVTSPLPSPTTFPEAREKTRYPPCHLGSHLPQPSSCLVVTTASGLGDCPLASRLVTSSPS